MIRSRRLSRRNFLQVVGSSAAALLVPPGLVEHRQFSVVDRFDPPMFGQVFVTQQHLEPVLDSFGEPTGDHHIGVDLNIGEGDEDKGYPIHLIGNGRCLLTSASEACGLGNIAIFEHVMANGTALYSRYAHLGLVFVKAGQSMRRGALVGQIGDSGCQRSAHLHLDIETENAWRESLQAAPRWYPQAAPVWWLRRRSLDPISLFSGSNESLPSGTRLASRLNFILTGDE
ncbi:MAG: M23 family metallopeptidase [Anaerolineales bacterium]